MEDRSGCGSLQTEGQLAHDVHDDGDIQTLAMPNLAELIVLDESGGEEEIDGDVEEGELKIIGDQEEVALLNGKGVDVSVLGDENETGVALNQQSRSDDRDSDIEIVSRGESSNSCDSRQSYLLDGDLNCNSEMQCQGLDCPFKIRHYSLMKRYRQVKRELKRLKRTSRSSRMIIQFPDKSLAKKYRTVVENFVNNLMTTDANGSSTTKPLITEGGSQARLGESFIIDKSGQNGYPFMPSLAGIRSPPFFERRFPESLLCMRSPDDGKEKTDALRPSLMSCFNCLGSHTIAECTAPRNSTRIAQNRNDFMQKKQNSSSPRYHVEEVRSGKFAPGKISLALRNALGLKRNELPIHIYKMRTIGYPPGWLKETEVYDSGLTVYDSEGKAEQVQCKNDVESDVQHKAGSNDPSKLVEFPGFNVALADGMIDDWKKLGFIPMQEKHKKDVMEQEMKDAASNKRKRSPDIETIESKEKCPKVLDMEIEEGTEVEGCKPDVTSVDSAPTVTPVALPVVKSDGATESLKAPIDVEDPVESALPSNSEVTLKSGNAPPQGTINSEIDSDSPEAVSLSLEDLESAKQKLITALDGDLAEEAVDCKSSPSFSGKSKAIYLGSPAIYQASSYFRLPDADKFATGISEHMSFENLPNSTGSFEKMRNVLKNIRKCLSAPD